MGSKYLRVIVTVNYVDRCVMCPFFGRSDFIFTFLKGKDVFFCKKLVTDKGNHPVIENINSILPDCPLDERKV